MPKKQTSKRLDDLFEDLQDAKSKPSAREKRKPAPRPVEKKASTAIPTRPAAIRAPSRPAPEPKPRALTPPEPAAITRRGGEGTPSSLSLAFQMDNRNWATLQVVDEAASRTWAPSGAATSSPFARYRKGRSPRSPCVSVRLERSSVRRAGSRRSSLPERLARAPSAPSGEW